ncbi:MAG: hypothetical protein ACP5LX_05355 [Nitrososphaeria archaeon]|jgi:hypothetical protein
MEKEIVRKIIESVFAEHGGEAARKVVMYHLENVLKVSPGDALEKPEEFVKALKAIYGSFENYVEAEICKKLAEEYRVNYSGNSLVELANELRSKRRSR